MRLRVRFSIAAALLLAACHASSGSNAVLPASSSIVGASAPKDRARVLLTLAVIAPPRPDPVPGIVSTRLSSATQSVAGTFGRSKVGPVALDAGTAGCTTQTDGLHCTVAMNVPLGTNQLDLSTFASRDGTGKPLATASEQLTVVAGSQNYATPKAWTAIAATYRLGFTKKIFKQGVPASTTISFLGIDAGGAIIPSNDISGSTGKAIKAQLQFAGNYPHTIALPENLPFTSATFAYDGRLSGTTVVTAIPVAPKAKTVYASAKMVQQQGSTENGQLYVYGSTTAYGSGELVQFAAGASGAGAVPLRTYQMNGAPLWADTGGKFWALFDEGLGPYKPPNWMEEFDSTGRGLARVDSPGNDFPFIIAAVDPKRNIYAAEGQRNESYPPCDLIAYMQVTVYAAARGWKPAGTLTLDSGCPRALAADSAGNLYIAYSDEYYSGSGGSASIMEYSTGSGSSLKRSISVPYGRVGGLDVDSHGNIFVSTSDRLYEYSRKSRTPSEILPNITIGAFTLDAHDNLYVVSGGSIQEYAPGASTPIRTIPVSVTGLVYIWSIVAAP
jgi:hypothetical protein